MTIWESIFFWLGVFSAALYVLLGISAFTAFVLNAIWRRFKDGKELLDLMGLYENRVNGVKGQTK